MPSSMMVTMSDAFRGVLNSTGLEPAVAKTMRAWPATAGSIRSSDSEGSNSAERMSRREEIAHEAARQPTPYLFVQQRAGQLPDLRRQALENLDSHD